MWPPQRRRCAVFGAVAGLWLLVSPALLGYADADVAWIQAAAGFVLLVVAAMALTTAWRSRALDWAVTVAGGSVLVAGVAVATAAEPRWNAVLAGGAVLVGGALRASGRVADDV